jgi:hypothetical protein
MRENRLRNVGRAARGESAQARRESAQARRESAQARPGFCAAVLFVLAALAAGVPVGAQQAGPASASPRTPASRYPADSTTIFVSRLKAEPVGYQVKLTWVDSPDLKGTCIVYRSAEEISGQTLAKATVIGSVATGAGSFIDAPPDPRGWFYAVLIRDTAGTLYPFLVPFRNKTSAPVSPQTAAPEEQLAAQVISIKAGPTGQGDIIEVSFSVSNPSRDLLLFWGPSAFARSEDLLRATRTTPLDPGTTRYVLAVLPGVDYWFAVLDAGLFKLGQAPLVKGANATAYHVQLQVTASHGLPAISPASRRGIPLPSLAIDRGVQTGQAIPATNLTDLPPARRISDSTNKSIAALQQYLTPPDRKAPRPEVLPSDATPTPGSEVARLQEIVQGPFLSGDMTGAQQRLQDFLSLPRKPPLSARARFYLGQVDYFQGKTRDALLEFLTAQDFYYQVSAPWIDACFAALEKSDL